MHVLIILIAYTLNAQTGDLVSIEQAGGPFPTVEACSKAAMEHPPAKAKDGAVTVFNCAVREVKGDGEDL